MSMPSKAASAPWRRPDELLSQARHEGAADIQRLVLERLAPYHGSSQARVAAIGPSVVLSPETAQAVAMADP